MAKNRIGNPRGRRGATGAAGLAEGAPSVRDPITRQRGGIHGHELIEALACDGLRHADAYRTFEAVKANPFTAAALTYQQSARQMLMGPASMYFTRFPLGADWQVLGTEMELAEGTVCDIAWLTADGRVLLDELKTGRLRLADLANMDEQVMRLCGAALTIFGDAFDCLRVCLLARPEESFTVDRSGARTPIPLSLPWETQADV